MKHDRLQQIRELIMEHGKVTNAELCERFHISIETIRRYMNQLEKEGFITKVYGGAVLAQSESALEYTEKWTGRVDRHHDEKRAIARAAAELIPNESIVFLDSGTSALEIAHFLSAKERLTIITSSLYIATHLCGYKNITTYCIGGLVNTDLYATIGFLALKFTSHFSHFDYAVVSSDGFTLDEGAMDNFIEIATLKKEILEKADKTILAVDHTKLNRRADCVTCRIDKIDTIITDSGADSDILAQLRSRGINVIVADIAL